jgi:hypothetical protein
LFRNVNHGQEEDGMPLDVAPSDKVNLLLVARWAEIILLPPTFANGEGSLFNNRIITLQAMT